MATACGRTFFVRSKTLGFLDLFSEGSIETPGMETAIKYLEVVRETQDSSENSKIQKAGMFSCSLRLTAEIFKPAHFLQVFRVFRVFRVLRCLSLFLLHFSLSVHRRQPF